MRPLINRFHEPASLFAARGVVPGLANWRRSLGATTRRS